MTARLAQQENTEREEARKLNISKKGGGGKEAIVGKESLRIGYVWCVCSSNTICKVAFETEMSRNTQNK